MCFRSVKLLTSAHRPYGKLCRHILSPVTKTKNQHKPRACPKLVVMKTPSSHFQYMENSSSKIICFSTMPWLWRCLNQTLPGVHWPRQTSSPTNPVQALIFYQLNTFLYIVTHIKFSKTVIILLLSLPNSSVSVLGFFPQQNFNLMENS